MSILKDPKNTFRNNTSWRSKVKSDWLCLVVLAQSRLANSLQETLGFNNSIHYCLHRIPALTWPTSSNWTFAENHGSSVKRILPNLYKYKHTLFLIPEAPLTMETLKIQLFALSPLLLCRMDRIKSPFSLEEPNLCHKVVVKLHALYPLWALLETLKHLMRGPHFVKPSNHFGLVWFECLELTWLARFQPNYERVQQNVDIRLL